MKAEGSAGSAGQADIAVDIAVEAEAWGAEDALRASSERAVAAASAELGLTGRSELSLVFTDDVRIRILNRDWRGKDKPTNVLSFPAFGAAPDRPLPPMLGDIVLARETIEREAALEEKPLAHHLSHLVVHGFLHLLGFDHESEDEAAEMEGAERRILARLAIGDPYAISENGD